MQDTRGIILSQINLAEISLAAKQLDEAEHYALKGFGQAIAYDYLPLLIESAPLLLSLCQKANAYKLGSDLSFALQSHPNTNPQLRLELERVQRSKEAKPPNLSGALSQLIVKVIQKLSETKTLETA
jgi:hypothetical protein